MILHNKIAVIYAGGGSIGGAVAKAFAREGASVFLTGRNMEPLKRVKDEICWDGGKAEIAVVDALDQQAVNDHIREVVKKAGTIDISFNAIDTQETQNIPLTEMKLEDFVRPVNVTMKTQFITTTAAAKIMIRQRFGVILSITATPGGIGYPLVGGFGPACCALEGYSTNLACELGQYGIRVINMRSAGSPDSRPFVDAINDRPDIANVFLQKMKEDTMLKTLPMLNDIGNTAAMLASGYSSKITGVTIDITCGTTAALNYKVLNVPLAQNNYS